MPAVNMLDAKTNLSRLVESLEKGAEREYIIARHGRPAARLVPFGRTTGAAHRRGERAIHGARQHRHTQRRGGSAVPRREHRVNLLLDTHVAI